MARLLKFRVRQGVAIVSLDNAPDNALTADLRADLDDVLTRIEANAEVQVVVLMGEGAVFSTGISVADMGETEATPTLSDICNRVETFPRPIIAALHGMVLGGAAELALAAHYRIADGTARFGFPDVSLGLVSGAGATQRLPRIAGAEGALNLLLGTRPMSVKLARAIGLVDMIVEGNVLVGAANFGISITKKEQPLRPTRKNRDHLKKGAEFGAAIAARRAEENSEAGARAIDCVEAAMILPFEAGLAFEATARDDLAATTQSRALRHMHLVDRRVDPEIMQRVEGKFVLTSPRGIEAEARLRDAMTQASEQAGEDQRRVMAALVVEGARMMQDGAVSASDIDAIGVHFLGTPRQNGGPMWAATMQGLISLGQDLQRWGEESPLWAAPDLIAKAALYAEGFEALSALTE